MELICYWCGEPVLEGERSPACANQPMHRECAFRAVGGSVAHVERRCSCYIPGSDEGDDPALTRRQAAMAAFQAFWHSQQEVS